MQPDSVVVELCRSRQAVMYPSPAAGTPGQGLASGGNAPGSGGGGAAVLQSVGTGSESEGEEDAQAMGTAQSSSSSSSSARNSSSSSSQHGTPAVNNFSLSGAGLLPAFSRSMELGGPSALLLRLLLSRLSARLAGSLGVQGGGEFVTAREEAEALGSQVGLGECGGPLTLVAYRMGGPSFCQGPAPPKKLLRLLPPPAFGVPF